METIRLVLPSEKYLDQVWAYRQECIETDGFMDVCGESAQEWLADVISRTDPATLPEGKVLSTQFLSVRESDGKVIGMIQVRHYFNEYAEKYSGLIGYSVRPCERCKGYAREQLRLALGFCKETLGLDRVLITCFSTNEASRRTILSAGGMYESTIHKPGSEIDFERFWIEL